MKFNLNLPPPDGPYDCSEHELYAYYVRNMVTTEDYNQQMALLISSKASLHQPVVVVYLPQLLEQYVNFRTGDKESSIDQAMSVRLSQWLTKYTESCEENISRLRVLRWALENTPSGVKENGIISAMTKKHTEVKYVSKSLRENILKTLERDSWKPKE